MAYITLTALDNLIISVLERDRLPDEDLYINNTHVSDGNLHMNNTCVFDGDPQMSTHGFL